MTQPPSSSGPLAPPPSGGWNQPGPQSGGAPQPGGWNQSAPAPAKKRSKAPRVLIILGAVIIGLSLVIGIVTAVIGFGQVAGGAEKYQRSEEHTSELQSHA